MNWTRVLVGGIVAGIVANTAAMRRTFLSTGLLCWACVASAQSAQTPNTLKLDHADKRPQATLADLRPRRRASAAARFVLARIFDNTRRMLAAILEAHADERALREAIEAFWSYQIPGLKGFARWSDRRPDAGRPGAGGASIP